MSHFESYQKTLRPDKLLELELMLILEPDLIDEMLSLQLLEESRAYLSLFLTAKIFLRSKSTLCRVSLSLCVSLSSARIRLYASALL